MKYAALGVVVFLLGCGTLVTEQRMARLETEVQAIQRDFRVLSATFTPEQQAKYTQAKTVQNDATFQAFLMALSPAQRTTMETLLARSHQASQEQHELLRIVHHDRAMRHENHRRLAGLTATAVVGVP